MDVKAEIRECACGHIRSDHAHYDGDDCLAADCLCDHFEQTTT